MIMYFWSMKSFLKILFILILGITLLGYYFENFSTINGKLYIGIAVVLFAFIFMPLFVYYRYKDRIGDFVDSRMEKEIPQSKEDD